MNRKTVLVTGAAALASAAALFGTTQAAAAAEPSASLAKPFTIQAVALPAAHTSVVGPDWKSCCGVAGAC